MPIPHRHHIIALLLAATATVASADRDEGDERYRDHDHDRARHALERGEIRPLAEILRNISATMPGEVVDVELERRSQHGRRHWAYELVIITPSGRLREVYVDAASSEILDVESD